MLRKLRKRGLRFMKIKEFTLVNDCFQKDHNDVIGVLLQPYSNSEIIPPVARKSSVWVLIRL